MDQHLSKKTSLRKVTLLTSRCFVVTESIFHVCSSQMRSSPCGPTLTWRYCSQSLSSPIMSATSQSSSSRGLASSFAGCCSCLAKESGPCRCWNSSMGWSPPGLPCLHLFCGQPGAPPEGERLLQECDPGGLHGGLCAGPALGFPGRPVLLLPQRHILGLCLHGLPLLTFPTHA